MHLHCVEADYCIKSVRPLTVSYWPGHLGPRCSSRMVCRSIARGMLTEVGEPDLLGVMLLPIFMSKSNTELSTIPDDPVTPYLICFLFFPHAYLILSSLRSFMQTFSILYFKEQQGKVLYVRATLAQDSQCCQDMIFFKLLFQSISPLFKDNYLSFHRQFLNNFNDLTISLL